VTPLLALLLVITPPAKPTQTAVFAGGCFWGIESVFEHVKGVVRATSGYSGGRVANPSYEEVSDGGTGHAESVEVVFDTTQVSYATLLEIFFTVAHDPTQLDHQGADIGPQYRSIVFYANEAQHEAAQSYIERLTGAHAFASPIVTHVQPLERFYPAEDYHQDYAEHHPMQPYILYVDAPKVERLKARFPQLYRETTTAVASR
jgi:peptide-methionine (S)-S-oxide reductase